MAAGRQLLKAQGRKQANWLETATAGITTCNRSPPGELDFPASLAISWSEPSAAAARQGESRQAAGPAQLTAQGPAVSPQSTAAAHTRGLPEAPQPSLKTAPAYRSCFPKETAGIPPKGAAIAAQDSLRAELSEFRESRKRRAAFSANTQGEQSTPRGSHQETKIRCYTSYQSKAVFTEHCFTKAQSTLTLKALSKPSYAQKYKSPNNVQAPCWTIKNLHPSLT